MRNAEETKTGKKFAVCGTTGAGDSGAGTGGARRGRPNTHVVRGGVVPAVNDDADRVLVVVARAAAAALGFGFPREVGVPSGEVGSQGVVEAVVGHFDGGVLLLVRVDVDEVPLDVRRRRGGRGGEGEAGGPPLDSGGGRAAGGKGGAGQRQRATKRHHEGATDPLRFFSFPDGRPTGGLMLCVSRAARVWTVDDAGGARARRNVDEN